MNKNDKHNDARKNAWQNVRPVVIYFAGEKFVVEYSNDEKIPPNPQNFLLVAMVHSYLLTAEVFHYSH
jgi:hypothetical protein